MKRHTVTLLALGASIFSAGVLLGQNKAASKADKAAPAPAPALRLVRVVTLETAQANREFTQNVQLVQAQRQTAVEINNAMEKEKDAAKKAELKKQLDSVLAKLNENNEKMQKAYGFSLTRNYIMEVERANVYLQVTEEEAAKIEAAEKQDRAKAGKK
jgi:uncharacterized membrane-anchored protein